MERYAEIALWLQADMGYSLVGGKVSALADQGPLHRDYVQASDPARFTWTASDPAYGGCPVLTSSSGAQFMDAGTAWTTNLPCTAYIAADTAAAAYESIVDNGDPGRAIIRGSPFGWEAYNGFAAIQAGTCTAPSIICVSFTGTAAAAIYLNPNTPAVSGNIGADPARTWRLGIAPGGVYALGTAGRIYSVMLFNGTDNATQRAQAMSYLSERTRIVIP